MIERPEIIAIIGFLVVIFTGLGVYRGEIRHNRIRSFQTLEIAVKDFMEAIQIEIIYFSYIKGRKEIRFRNVFFDTTVYETIVHSGLLTYFPREVQIAITQLYSRIRNHNDYLKYRIELANTFSLYGQLTAILVGYYKVVARTDIIPPNLSTPSRFNRTKTNKILRLFTPCRNSR